MKNFSKMDQHNALLKLVTMSLLVAMEVVLSRFFSYQQWNIKFSVAFVPVLITAILYGPLSGGIVGAVSDFIGTMLFPIGPYFPGYTFCALWMGIVYGIFLHKKQNLIRIVIAVLINQIVFSWGLNSLWIAMTNGVTYMEQVSARTPQFVGMTIIMIPLSYLVVSTLVPSLKKVMVRT